MAMLYGGGVDVGSTQTKGVVVDQNRQIVARGLIDTGANVSKAAERVFHQMLEEAGIHRDDVGAVVGTGYGRYKVGFGDTQITEISCHAKGAWQSFPNTRTVVDIGGQDAKGIAVGDNGEVRDFSMNDKCAAGTGRFLANSADALNLGLGEIGELSLLARHPVRLSTVCTVFVESDILSYLAQGKKIEDILGGVHSAIAARTVALMRRVGIEPEVTFTGGVSRNIGIVKALEEKLGVPLNVSPDAHFMGAFGAALFALERAESALAPDVVLA
jgi:(R)-2-hydroxyacyl-CoA dehydratese activating ATPase